MAAYTVDTCHCKGYKVPKRYAVLVKTITVLCRHHFANNFSLCMYYYDVSNVCVYASPESISILLLYCTYKLL